MCLLAASSKLVIYRYHTVVFKYCIPGWWTAAWRPGRAGNPDTFSTFELILLLRLLSVIRSNVVLALNEVKEDRTI